MTRLLWSFSGLLLILCNTAKAEPMEVTYRFSEYQIPSTLSYEYQILRLALLKSEPEYGPFNLVASPPMNKKRATIISQNNSLTNFVYRENYTKALYDTKLSFIPLPVDLGIFGYRVCFMAKSLQTELPRTMNLARLKTYTYGQHVNWLDVNLLRHNGFHVKELQSFTKMFEMVTNRRFDFLCRGANEVKTEFEVNSHNSDLALDDSFALYYPLPRFFWTHKSNTLLLERLNLGLKRAFDDGSLVEIWNFFFKDAVKYSKLTQRKIFYLENPELKGVEIEYDQFMYHATEY